MLQPAPLQTTYDQYLDVASLGKIATMVPWSVDTRIAETATSIGFGLAVCQGTLHGDKSALIGTASGSVFVGITAADITLINADINVSNTDKYVDGDNMAVLTLGDIWVAPTTTVVAGEQVYFNTSTGELGDHTISNAQAIANSMWMTSKPYSANGNEGLLRAATLAIARLGSMA